MKVEIDKVKKPTAQEMYQVGNVIRYGETFHLVVTTNYGFGLLDIDWNKVINESKTLQELVEKSENDEDELIDVKIVRA